MQVCDSSTAMMPLKVQYTIEEAQIMAVLEVVDSRRCE